MNSEEAADTVVVAELVRPRGVRGELLAISQTDVPGRLESLKRAWVTQPDGRPRQVELEAAWAYKEFWVLKLAGVDSVEAADQFRGRDLWVPRAERAELPAGELFRSDLIGCAVADETGRVIGEVSGFQQYGGPPLLEVRSEGREVLIPFVEAICRKVDLEGRVILVDLPEGLLNL